MTTTNTPNFIRKQVYIKGKSYADQGLYNRSYNRKSNNKRSIGLENLEVTGKSRDMIYDMI